MENNWYHLVAVFDPSENRTSAYLNNQAITLNSIGFDSNTNFLRIGRDFSDRTFDGLIDDIRVWGRPLTGTEVSHLWGNGMGDLGPQVRFDTENPTWTGEIQGTLQFNQSILDFNYSEDLTLNGLSISEISEIEDSNGTAWDFTLIPDAFSPSQLSISLNEAAVMDSKGVENEEVLFEIDFRPHREAESQLVLWWELNEGAGNQAFDSSNSFDPSWTPGSAPSNNLIWLDASDASTVVETLGTVSAWNDKSSSCNHLTPHNSSDRTTGIETQNGLNVLSFDGDDILTRETTNNFIDRDQTWFVVAKVNEGTVSDIGDAFIAYDSWFDGNWQIQSDHPSEFRGRVVKNIPCLLYTSDAADE